MSLGKGGKQILCDGEGCHAVAPVPVALRSRLTADEVADSSVEGWLFVVREGACLHFCPNCVQEHLNMLNQAAER